MDLVFCILVEVHEEMVNATFGVKPAIFLRTNMTFGRTKSEKSGGESGTFYRVSDVKGRWREHKCAWEGTAPVLALPTQVNYISALLRSGCAVASVMDRATNSNEIIRRYIKGKG